MNSYKNKVFSVKTYHHLSQEQIVKNFKLKRILDYNGGF